VRAPIPNIRIQLRALLETRSPLAATLVAGREGYYIVFTLAPRAAARLLKRRVEGLWETRVHPTEPPPRAGLGLRPRYAVLSGSVREAEAHHEALVGRVEAGTFEAETAREVLRATHPLIEGAAGAFERGDESTAMAALNDLLQAVDRVDPLHAFLHLYQEAYLMRGIILERTDPTAAKAAYREFIALRAEVPLPHPDTLRAAAWAREAVERLTPTPAGDRVQSAFPG
jgi:hypothetical protein